MILILAGFATRLWTVSIPPFEGRLAWRQYDTAPIARNIAEGQFRVFYPQIDWRGNSPGYVESEFQIYTALVAVLYRLFTVRPSLAEVLDYRYSPLFIGPEGPLYRLEPLPEDIVGEHR